MPSVFSLEDRQRIRGQLLAEGRKMMLERGITKTNIEELAESAGIAKGTFYHFFSSKQDFILEIIHAYQNEKLEELKNLVAEKRGKLTVEEALAWYQTVYLPQENPVFHIGKKDMDWIESKIPPEKLFRPEIDIETGKLILSMIEGVREDIDYGVLANFPKMVCYAIQNADSMHKQALPKNFELIIDCMLRYIKGD